MRRSTPVFLVVLVLTCGCAGMRREASWYNPLAVPGKCLSAAGFAAADSEIPLLAETGRLLQAVGVLTAAPGLAVEGAVTLDGGALVGGGEGLVAGCGSTITGLWNMPFFWLPGRNIDLGRDAELVNEALAHLEAQPPETVGVGRDDPRTFIFPKGTRVRASGGNLIWTVPGYGEIIQAGEANRAWSLLQTVVGTQFPAQERSWGFIVRTRARWDRTWDVGRVRTIIHEFYHQHMQMRDWLLGWTVVYWPAYIATFPFTGWANHWAEAKGPRCAAVVDVVLNQWLPKNSPYRKYIDYVEPSPAPVTPPPPPGRGRRSPR